MIKLSPGIKTQAKISGDTIKGIYHIIHVKPELLIIKVQRPRLPEEHRSEVSINAPIPSFVGICKGRSGDGLLDT